MPWPSSFSDVVELAVTSPNDRATVRPARGVPSGRSTWTCAVHGWGWMAIAKAVSRPSTTATPSALAKTGAGSGISAAAASGPSARPPG